MGFLRRRFGGITVSKSAGDFLDLQTSDFSRLSGVKKAVQDTLNLAVLDVSRTNGVKKQVTDGLGISLGEAATRVIRRQYMTVNDSMNVGMAEQAAVAGPGILGLSAASYSTFELTTLQFQVVRGNGDINRVRITWTLTGLSSASPSATTGTVTFLDRDSAAKTVSITFGSVGANVSGQLTLSNPENLDGGQVPSLGTTTASVTVVNDAGQNNVIATSWANFNLAVNPINAIDLSAQDYPIWTPNNAVYHTYIANGSWKNGPVARIKGSQVAQTACGLGSFVNLWRNGTLPIRKLNLLFQVRFGPTMIQNWTGSDWKFIIAHSWPSLVNNSDPGGGERPMVHLAWTSDVNDSGPSKLGMSVACSTLGNFVRSPPFAPAFGPTPNSDWFLGAAAGTYNGKPIIGPMEWLNIELEIIAESTAEAPNGRIRYVITRRTGQQFDLSINWTYDSNWSLGDYLHGVQLLGGFWNQAVNASDSGTWYEIADRITFAANRPGLLEAPADFITG